jgi:hypothetical protein
MSYVTSYIYRRNPYELKVKKTNVHTTINICFFVSEALVDDLHEEGLGLDLIILEITYNKSRIEQFKRRKSDRTGRSNQY